MFVKIFNALPPFSISPHRPQERRDGVKLYLSDPPAWLMGWQLIAFLSVMMPNDANVKRLGKFFEFG